MKALIQRVSQASVSVDGESIASINHGMLVLLGIERGDDSAHAEKLAHRTIHYRLFSDDNGKMHHNLQQSGGSMLLVSQFTLAAHTNKGLRPDFGGAAQPENAQQLYQYFIDCCVGLGITPACGQFGAYMQVVSINDGPVTFLLEV